MKIMFVYYVLCVNVMPADSCKAVLYFELYSNSIIDRQFSYILQIAPTETPFVFQQYLRDTIQHVLCNDDGTVLATSRLLVVSRLAFQNTAGFWNLFTQQSGQQSTEAVLAFLKVVCDRIDSVVDTGQRKLVALASLTLLERFTDRDALQRALSCALSVCIQVTFSGNLLAVPVNDL